MYTTHIHSYVSVIIYMHFFNVILINNLKLIIILYRCIFVHNIYIQKFFFIFQ